ncbi:cytochrome P450 2K1-like [Neosynchiropus ocellatus]
MAVLELLLQSVRSGRISPPGPRPLPLLGHLLQLDLKRPHVSPLEVRPAVMTSSALSSWMDEGDSGSEAQRRRRLWRGSCCTMEAPLESLTSVSLIVALLVLVLVYFSPWSWPKRNEREPPGPRPLPLVGNLLQMDLKGPQNTMMKLYKEFGSVFQIYVGPKKVVVLAGLQTLQEALVDHTEEFGERDGQRIIQEFSRGHGVVWSNGPSWREMKRFCVATLQDFGAGPAACEKRILEESQHLVAAVSQFSGEPFETTGPLTLASCNAICFVLLGFRFRYDDPEFTAMVDRHKRTPTLVGSPSVQLYNLFPSLGRWIGNRREFLDVCKQNYDQCVELLAGLRASLDTRVSRSFVDAFLIKKKELEDSGITDSHYHDENLVSTVQNLIGAGTDATGTTLRWALMLMAKFPHIQDQVQQELRSVTGDRQVRLEDRTNLPFSNAVVHETQRFANIAPISVPHRTSQDVTFQGHFIQKGTTVTPLLSSAHFDERQWDTPHSFNPAHFLDPDGRFVQREAFLPFSAGQRGCAGQHLAKSILFIFFTSLLKRFRFSPPPGVSEDDLDLSPQLLPFLSPQPHQLCAVQLP